MSDIIKCKFAGDPEDEYCRECDGLHPVDDNGNQQEAPSCGGYEPCEVANCSPAHDTHASNSETCAESCENVVSNKQHTVGITSVIRAESGVSREVNGTWYKFMFSEERILPEGCDIEAEKQSLWQAVNAEVDAQLDSVIN